MDEVDHVADGDAINGVAERPAADQSGGDTTEATILWDARVKIDHHHDHDHGDNQEYITGLRQKAEGRAGILAARELKKRLQSFEPDLTALIRDVNVQ